MARCAHIQVVKRLGMAEAPHLFHSVANPAPSIPCSLSMLSNCKVILSLVPARIMRSMQAVKLPTVRFCSA